MNKHAYRVFLIFAVISFSCMLFFTGCGKTDKNKKAVKTISASSKPADIPDIEAKENSPMKEFSIIVHGVSDQTRYFEEMSSQADELMTLSQDKETLLDAYAPGVMGQPGYPITIKCIPNDGVTECADKLMVYTDYGSFYMNTDEGMKSMGQSFEMKPNYTCFFKTNDIVNEAYSFNDVENIKIVAYYKDEPVKEISLIVNNQNSNTFVTIAPENK